MADGNMAELKELGTLIVVVGKARNLPNKSRFGKQDPFCTVAINEEKQRTKAIKRGGQHPEWDEELRFTIHEDVDDLLVRSESQNQFDSLPSSMSSKHASLSSHMNPSHPTPPPKDSAAASLNSSLSGSVTAQSLANKSRKGPINKKGGKSLKVACYADDAKEPELIGECNVPIDEVLKQGEVDEWYEFSFKDKYSGEVYLELTFYSNDAPPIKRNVPRPSVHPYDLAGSASSSTLNARQGGLVSSGSVSGMNLYIPPYVQSGRVSPGPSRASGSFADLGLPAGHRQSLNASASVNTMDALTRPMSGLSIANAPPVQQAPPPQQSHGYGHHRHSLGGGGADAPWAQALPQNQPSQHAGGLRPMSAAESMSHIPIDRRRTPQPQAFPGSQDHRGSVPLPIPSSLIPGQGAPRHGEPRPHAQSFSGPTRPVVPPPQPSYLQPSPGPTPPPHPNSAPPNSLPPQQQQPHYQMPTSSFGGLAQAPYDPYDPRSASPYPGDPHQPPGVAPQPPSRSNSVPVRQPSPQPPGSYQDQQYYPDRSHTPRPSYPGSNQPIPAPQQTPPYAHGGHSSHSSYSGPSGVQPTQTPPHDPRVQAVYGQQPSYGYQASHPPAPPAPPPREPTPNSQGYIPWYQQTQAAPTPAPPPSQPSYNQHSYQAPAPPPVPAMRPQSAAPPAPLPSRPSVGYYPSDELYAQQDQRPPAEPPRSRTPQPAPWQQAPPQPQRPVSPQPPPAVAPWQQSQPQAGGQASYGGYQPPAAQAYDNRYTPSPAPTPTTQPYPPVSASSSYSSYNPNPGYQDQSYPSSSTSPAPYAPQPTPSPYQNINVGSSPPRTHPPPGWQSSVPTQTQAYPPRAPSPMQPNGWNAAPAPAPQPARAPSPLPTQIGQDWRSYMQSLSTPSNSNVQPQPGRSPSPAPPPPPAQGSYYTPPPNLPSSLKPPNGWQSTTPTSSDGHQWKR